MRIKPSLKWESLDYQEKFVLDKLSDNEQGETIAYNFTDFSDEELKHQDLFRKIERKIADGLPDGYNFIPDPNDVATAVLQKSTWAVLALTLHIELFTQLH